MDWSLEVFDGGLKRNLWHFISYVFHVEYFASDLEKFGSGSSSRFCNRNGLGFPIKWVQISNIDLETDYPQCCGSRILTFFIPNRNPTKTKEGKTICCLTFFVPINFTKMKLYFLFLNRYQVHTKIWYRTGTIGNFFFNNWQILLCFFNPKNCY